MTVHKRFGENLRSLCFSYASISDVCTGIGINRQQFNKYLAGQCLPSAPTLRRICSFLNTTEEQLFGVAKVAFHDTRAVDSPNLRMHNHVESFIADKLQRLPQGESATGRVNLNVGYYFCYFPLQNSEAFLIRSFIKIYRIADLTYFSRLTVFPSQYMRNRYLARGKHLGLVFASEREFYFLGSNRLLPNQLSFMAFERTHTGSIKLMNGLAVTRSGTGTLAVRACLQYLGPQVDIRKTFKQLGPVSISSPGLDPFVVASMTVQPTQFRNQMTPVNFDESFSSSISGATSHSVSITAALSEN
jgi:transcriptional regulator with XRE-family HTH domain